MVGSAVSAVATIGSSFIANRGQRSAARSAADAEVQAAEIATDFSREVFETTREDQAPFRAAGLPALSQLARAAGIGVREVTGQQLQPGDRFSNIRIGDNVGPEGARRLEAAGFTLSPVDSASGFRFVEALPGTTTETEFFDTGVDPVDFARQQTDQLLANFEASPDFEFRRSEGLNAIQNAQAARGISLSPFALRDVGRFASDLASTEFGNFANRRFSRFDQLTNQLASVAGLAQTGNQATQQAGQAFAANAGNAALSAGQAQAQGFINQGNANTALAANVAGAINTGLQNFSFNRALQPQGVSNPAITGFGPQGGP